MYLYVSYRVGDGPDAEDITSEVFERALRYRDSYDASRGDRRGMAHRDRPAVHRRGRTPSRRLIPARAEEQAPGRMDEDVQQRLTLKAALAVLGRARPGTPCASLRGRPDRPGRSLIVLELKVNAVEVGLHRALARLREILESEGIGEPLKELLASHVRVRPLSSVIGVQRRNWHPRGGWN